MKGFSLIEVLLALFIISFGLLSIAALQTTALRRSYDSYLHSIAVTQLAAMFDRLQVGSIEKESIIWNQVNAELLPQGQGNYPVICWFERLEQKTTCLKND